MTCKQEERIKELEKNDKVQDVKLTEISLLVKQVTYIRNIILSAAIVEIIKYIIELKG